MRSRGPFPSILVAVCTLGAALWPGRAAAATFTVTNTNDTGAGSLRQAITSANAAAGLDFIVFAIPGAGPHTIVPLSPLPDINSPVSIDGTTQPGFAGAPIIELNFLAASVNFGFIVPVGGSTFRGLVLNRYFAAGMLLHSVGGNVIQGCYIGTDVTGNVVMGANGGIAMSASNNNLIGGTTAAARNVIAGNAGGDGINVSGCTGTVIQGNYIGTNASGTAALPNNAGISLGTSPNTLIGGTVPRAGNLISGNNSIGINIQGVSDGTLIQGNLIGTDVNGTVAIRNGRGINVTTNTVIAVGGTTPAARNVVSGNGVPGDSLGSGVHFFGSGGTVQGNFIGTDVTGAFPIPNSGNGVLVQGPTNLIGGTAPGAGNRIAFNALAGVSVVTSFSGGTPVRGNAILNNGGLGIDLGVTGPTPNDPVDADGGANLQQNFPVITSVSFPTGNTNIQGTLNSAANTTFTLEFFGNPACDPSGFGEGEAPLGTAMVTTNGAGDAAFNVTFPSAGGPVITATATDPGGNTSEFSQCPVGVPTATPTQTGTATPTVTPTPPPNPGLGGQTFNEFRVCPPGSGPTGVASGPDGAIWFTESAGNRIGRITMNGVISDFPVLTAASQPDGIASGPDGALWFTESAGNRIGRITTVGVVTEFPLPNPGSSPRGITAGPDGALWFTESAGNRIGRITTAGVITEFPLPNPGSSPVGITSGPDGALWFTESGGHRIGRVTTGGAITEFPLPGGTGAPHGIASGADGALWFTEAADNEIGRISTGGAILEFPLPTPGSAPRGIAPGADLNLWFTESNGSRIGRITPGGAVTEFPIPTASGTPEGIIGGPDGALWFAEVSPSKIGRITTSGESGGNRFISVRFPILADSNLSGAPGTGDTAVRVVRLGDQLFVLGPWEDCSGSNLNVLTGSNPDGMGRFQTFTRIHDDQTEQATVSSLSPDGRPTGISMQVTGPGGNRTGSGGLFDTNGDGVADGIVGNESGGQNLAVMMSFVYSDVTGDGRPDYVSLPWAQTSILGTQPIPGSTSNPQVWIPLADTTGDGIPDTVAFDLDGDGAADPGSFLGPLIGPNPAGSVPGRFYTLAPCRVIDTRNAVGPFGGPALAANAERTFAVVGQCGIPADARAISVNLTVTQPTAQGHLSIYPAGGPIALVSAMNYRADQTRANNAIVLLGASGDFTVSCSQLGGTTHFILDVNGYFAAPVNGSAIAETRGGSGSPGRRADWILLALTAGAWPAAWLFWTRRRRD